MVVRLQSWKLSSCLQILLSERNGQCFTSTLTCGWWQMLCGAEPMEKDQLAVLREAIWAAEVWQDMAAWEEKWTVCTSTSCRCTRTQELGCGRELQQWTGESGCQGKIASGGLFLAQWAAHDTSCHLKRDATLQMAHDYGMDLTMDTTSRLSMAVKQAEPSG